VGNSDNKMFAHIFANTCIPITTSIKLPILFHNTVRSLLPDIAIRYAIYNLVLGAQTQNKPSFTRKVKKKQELKKLGTRRTRGWIQKFSDAIFLKINS